MAVSPRARTLAQAMAQLPEPPADSRPPHWDFWRHDLWVNAQRYPAEYFMGWPCVYHTMTVQHFDIGHQVDYLREDWARWEAACALPLVGQPSDSYAGTRLSRNLLNQAYHLKLWEDSTGRRVEDLASICEFGGGYGALALLCHRLGFEGDYLIQDLPEFAALQRWFLAAHALEVEHADAPADVDLFVGIYSISETPIELRRRLLADVQAKTWLLLYSSRFADYDNLAWAREMVAEHAEHTWRLVQFPGRPDHYAIGWRTAEMGAILCLACGRDHTERGQMAARIICACGYQFDVKRP